MKNPIYITSQDKQRLEELLAEVQFPIRANMAI